MSNQIKEILLAKKKNNKPCISFEIFPPHTLESTLKLGEALREMKNLRPDYISVTYGAGGSTRTTSLNLCQYVQNVLDVPTMAHYTCVGASDTDLSAELDKFLQANIVNYMLLRGDPPKNQAGNPAPFSPAKDGYQYAYQLVELLKDKLRKKHIDKDFTIGVAGCPEGHVEADSLSADIKNFDTKIKAGADFVVTQMFFDNRYYFDFIDVTAKMGIDKPIIPGILPITSYAQVKKFSAMCGSKIPANIEDELEKIKDSPSKVQQLGIKLATEQCLELLQKGAPGIHFYLINRTDAVKSILKNLGL